jgi:anti-sigma-K factor RskA
VTHEELRDLLAACALDALPPDDTRAVETHLATCAECRAELAALRETAAGLATGVEAVEPPAALKSRIMRSIEAGTTTAEPGRVPSLPPRRPWPLVAAALAAALAVVMAGVNVSLTRRLATLGERLTTLNERLTAQEQVLALLASPSAKVASLAGSVQASVRFVYDPARRQGALVASDLRDPGAEFVYQVWLVAGQTPESAGVFKPVAGRPIIVPVQADFSRYQAVAISIERGPGGAAQPSAAPILLATL